MVEENKTALAPAAAPAPAPAPSVPASTGGGGKKNNKVIIIIVVVVVVLGIIGYAAQRYFVRKVAEKSVESLLSGATSGKVSVDSSGNGGVTVNSNGSSVSTGSKSTWPATMPAIVPEFTYGTIISSSTSSDESYKAWSASFENVTSDALTKYSDALVAKGWTQTYSTDGDGTSGRFYDTEAYTLTLTISSTEKTAAISVTAK